MKTLEFFLETKILSFNNGGSLTLDPGVVAAQIRLDPTSKTTFLDISYFPAKRNSQTTAYQDSEKIRSMLKGTDIKVDYTPKDPDQGYHRISLSGADLNIQIRSEKPKKEKNVK